MPLFFQEEINSATKIGIWKIEEDEMFFQEKVPLKRNVTHPHKRLQHLAGRFLLQYLVPHFPGHLIKIADTKKPYLSDETYHFSISHCGSYAAAIISRQFRVGVDIEIPSEKVKTISGKFISEQEFERLCPQSLTSFTQIWSAKEAVFKWYGLGKVDFRRHIRLDSFRQNVFTGIFEKTSTPLRVHTKVFPELVLSYIVEDV